MGCDQGRARERQGVLAETKALKGEGPRAPGGEGPVSQPISRTCRTLGTWLGSWHRVLLPRGGANSFQWVWHYRSGDRARHQKAASQQQQIRGKTRAQGEESELPPG